MDLVTRDENGEVVVETKFYSIGGLSDEPFGQARGAVQFSDSWVEQAIQDQVQRGDISVELRDELLTSPDRNLRGDVRKRVVFVQNQDSPTTTLTDSFIKMASQDNYGKVDEVTILKTGRQITGVDS